MTLLYPELRTEVNRARPRLEMILGGVVLVAVGVLLSGSTVGRLLAIGVVTVLTLRWPVDRLIVGMLVMYIVVDDPAGQPFNQLWDSPVQHVGDFWYDTVQSSVPFLPVPVAPMLLVPIAVLTRAALGRVGPNLAKERLPVAMSPALGKMLLAGLAVVPTMILWGAVSGGSIQQMYYQIFGILIALCLLGATARVANPALSAIVWRIVLAAAIYRAGLAVYVYLTVAREIEGDPPLYLTTHYDSLLWAIALAGIVSALIEHPDRRTRLMALTVGPWLGLAIVVNNRRLAWVVVACAIVYIVLSASPDAHRRLRKISVYAMPLLMAYAMAGLAAPPSRFFAPVQSLQSVVTGDDRSSQTRGIEDFNLVFTTRLNFPLPTGFGHPYIEFVRADDISAAFSQYLYLPHNSILGMLMYVGPVGLGLLLAPLALSVAFSHRIRRAAENPEIRTETAMILTTWIAFLAGGWGDLGLFTAFPMAMVGIACGLGAGLHNWYRHYGGLVRELR